MIEDIIIILLLVLASLNIFGIAFMIVKKRKMLVFLLSILEMIIVGGLLLSM